MMTRRKSSQNSPALPAVRWSLFALTAFFSVAFFASLGVLASEIPGDDETDVDLLTPLENLINTDPRVYRTKGLDGLPSVGIQRGVEIVVPYRIYLPRRFFADFSILVSVKPKDEQGGYLFAVVNAFDTVVDLGVLLAPAGRGQTNISLVYTDSQVHSSSKVLASFVVPSFTNQWTQFSFEVSGDTVALYFRCMRFATRQVTRRPVQLQMDDASKLYIANAGPIIGGGFEGAIQELKVHDDPAEASNQCNEDWWKEKRRNSSRRKGDEASGFPSDFENELPSKQLPSASIDDNRLDDDSQAFTPNIGVQPTTTPPIPTTIREISPVNDGTHDADAYDVVRASDDGSRYSKPEFVRGEKGEKGDKGDPGPPGVCPADCAALYPPVPAITKLTDSDIERIANSPSVQAAATASAKKHATSTLHHHRPQPQATTELPPYDPATHRVRVEKGERGERGERGPPGPPGPPGIPGPGAGVGGGRGIVAVYQTSTELFAAAHQTALGQLAFSISSQQLFIRINNGWANVRLEGFHPAAEQRPPVTASEEVVRPSAPPPAVEPQRQHHHHHRPPATLSPQVTLRPRDEEPENDEQSRPQAQGTPTRQEEPPRPPPQLPKDHKSHPDKQLHLIALNRPLNGDMKGIRGADILCYQQARQAGYRTTFRAFVSSRVQDLIQLVHHADRDSPVVNARGERLFDSWSDIFGGVGPAEKPLYSFSQRDVLTDHHTWPEKYVWHGSDDAGIRSVNGYCESWRTSDPYAHGMASVITRGQGLITDGELVSCRRQLIVLCVENMSKYSSDVLLTQRYHWRRSRR